MQDWLSNSCLDIRLDRFNGKRAIPCLPNSPQNFQTTSETWVMSPLSVCANNQLHLQVSQLDQLSSGLRWTNPPAAFGSFEPSLSHSYHLLASWCDIFSHWNRSEYCRSKSQSHLNWFVFLNHISWSVNCLLKNQIKVACCSAVV